MNDPLQTTISGRTRAFARRWLPYWLAAAGLFLATATVGAAVGAERQSFILPVRAPGDPIPHTDALSLFVHNVRINLLIGGGVLLLGLPTVFLLAYNGFLFGSTMTDAMGTLGPLRAIALVAPHGVVELPALWLAGAIGLRWLHLFWSLASGGSFATGVPRAVLDSVVALLLLVAMTAVAAIVEAGVTVPVARLLT